MNMTLECGSPAAAFSLAPISSRFAPRSISPHCAPDPAFRAVLRRNHHTAAPNIAAGKINIQYVGESPIVWNTTTYPIETSTAGITMM
jgi:hypothetical protein